MNFRYITHLDTFAVVAQLAKLHPHTWKANPACDEMTDPRMPHKTLLLRVQNDPTLENWLDDLPAHDRPEMEKWVSLQRLLERARKMIVADPIMRDLVDPTAPLGRVVISVLQKASYMAWHTDLGEYAKRHVRFHIPLVTNPLCFVHCRNEQVHMPVGALMHLNALAPHCAANWGDHARSHLIFELRRAGVDQGEDQ